MGKASIEHKEYLSHALEVFVNLGLLAGLVAVCLLILGPFLPLIVWGIVIAVVAEPSHRKLQRILRGRKTVAVLLFAIALIAVVLVPVVMFTGSALQGLHTLAEQVKDGSPLIPSPPARVATWPIIGTPLSNAWERVARSSSGALFTFTPEIKVVLSRLLSISAGIGLAVLQWILAIIIAAYLLLNDASSAELSHSFARRLFGEKGQEFEDLASATIRSVTIGIIGVAVIQSAFAAAGFLVAGLPGAGLWAIGFLFLAVLQIGGIVLVPAVVYVFATASTTKAVIFLVWCVLVGVMDNVLKPLLLGRGVPVPVAVVFAGAIGGFVGMGPIGLFVGSVLLSVGYKLLLAWLKETPQVGEQGRELMSAGK